jgi:hypothetical protein
MRRAPQEGQNPLPLQLKPTSFSSLQLPQRNRPQIGLKMSCAKKFFSQRWLSPLKIW